MSDHDLPPELRRRDRHPEVLSIEVPLEDELPPLLNPDRDSADEQRNPEPFLRRS
jgi:hypothetical protein